MSVNRLEENPLLILFYFSDHLLSKPSSKQTFASQSPPVRLNHQQRFEALEEQIKKSPVTAEIMANINKEKFLCSSNKPWE